MAQAPPLTDTQPTSHVPPNNLFAAKAANLCQNVCNIQKIVRNIQQNVRNIQQIVRNIQQIVRILLCKGMFEHVLAWHLFHLAVAPIILLNSCLSTQKSLHWLRNWIPGQAEILD